MSYLWNKPVVLVLAAAVCVVGVLLGNALLLLLGALLVAFALQRLPDAPPLPGGDGRPFFFYAAGLAALALCGLAALLARGHNFQLNSFDTLLWVLSICLVTAAAVWHDRTFRPAATQAPTTPPRGRRRWLDAAIIVVITAVALALRVAELPTLPPAVHGDEGEVGMLALRVLGAGEPLPLFATTVFGHNPAGFPYLAAPLVALFGRNETGLRMLAALFGAAGVPFLYLIGRRGWGVLAGAAAAWLMATAHFHVHYSRIAVPNIGNAFVVVLLVWTLFRAYGRNVAYFADAPAPERASPGARHTRLGMASLTAPLTDFVVVGLVLGLGQYIYHGSRLLPLIAGFAFLYLLFLRRVTVSQILAAGIAALVSFGPLAVFFLGHWEEFVGRSGTVFILSEANLKHAMGADATFADDLLPYLQLQFVTTLSFLTGTGDRSSFYVAEIPAFDPISLVLLWLGFGVLLTRIRRFEESLIAAWFLLGMLFAGFLTTEQPNGPRLISVAPACYVIAGIFVQRVWSSLPASTSRGHRRLAVAAFGGLALLLLFVNWRTYFVETKNYTYNVFPTVVARAVAQAPADAAIYILGDPILYAGHGTIRFLGGREDALDLRTAAELPPQAGEEGEAFFIALEPLLGELQAIEDQHPGGDRASYTDARGNFLYATYSLPAEP